MRTLLGVAAAALAIAGAAEAQPVGHYTGDGANYAYTYQPPQTYDSDGSYVPGGAIANGYDGYLRDSLAAPNAGANGADVSAIVVMPDTVAGHPAADRFGPDLNGTLAPDGHVIKCKIVDGWDGYGHLGPHRECR